MADISQEERNQLRDEDFGIPAKKLYPFRDPKHPDEAHDRKQIESAVTLFGKAKVSRAEREELARRILKRARELKMDTSGWKQILAFAQEQVPPMSDGTSLGNAPPRTMAPYYDEASEDIAQKLATASSQAAAQVTPTTEESITEDPLFSRIRSVKGAEDPFEFAKRIVEEIHAQVEKDSKPPTGNQNCQLCTWCAEARYRGINALPRPIYSPRDPAFSIVGETIVANPVKQKIHNQRQVVETVRGAVDSRWYVHVNWKDSTGGHEFLMINIKDYAYIMDAQAGMLKELDETDSTNSYFRDINYANSYMVRLDTKKFNTELFMSTNDPSKVLPWKNSLDIPYMRDNGMLAPGADDDPRFRRVFVPSDEGLKYLKDDPELSQYWEDMHKATKGEFLVDRDTGEAIGHAFVHTNKKDKGFIFNVEVTPKYRRQGYGWILIDDAVQRFGGVDLTVRCDNEPAVNLYLQYGFEIYKKGVWFDPPNEEYWMKLKKELIPKPVQEGSDPTKLSNKLIPVKDYPFDTVYKGAMGELKMNPLFVTPYKGIASIFAAHDAFVEKLHKMGLRSFNSAYDEWNYPPEKLQDILKVVHVKISSYEGKTFEPFEIDAEGFVYTFDVSNLKDKIYRYNWMDPDKEALVANYGQIEMPGAEKVTIHYIVEPVKHIQEGVVGKVIAGGITIFALINLAIAVKDAIKKKRYEKNTPTDGKLLTSIEKFLTYYNDLEYKDFLTDTGIRYEYIHDTMEDLDSHLKTIIKYTTECINTTSNCYKSNEKMFKEFFTECKTTRVALWDIVCKLDDHVNDYDVDEHCIDKTAMKYRKHYKTLLDQLMKHIEKFLKTLQKTIDSKNVVQEGAFQDLKNGVNPYSDDLVFHVSMDKHIDGQVWKPRVPDYLDPYNPEDTGFEDNTTPRICFSTSIEGALNGITVNIQRQSPDTFDKMYVYIPEKPWKEYKHKTNKQLVKDKLVYDANVTREVWIMEPVRMKLYGVIRVDQIADAKRKSVVPTSKGQKDTRNYFTYKWHWVVKPKVLKKATKFDYSPERVIDDLCVDVKKFKYGLIKDGRLQTGNVSDADYDKYWVFHSGEEVDRAGGGNCYDMVEYEAGYLDAFGVAYKKYFMNFTDTKNTKTINTHTICVVPHNGKFIYIEQAFKRVVDEWGYERKKEFDKLNDVFEYVAEVSAEYDNQDLNYGVWDYTDAEIDYGTPIKNFQDWIMTKCKMIHDGEAIKSKPMKESFVIPTRFSECH